MLTKSIPAAAKPIVKIIRRRVKRPSYLPTSELGEQTHLRFGFKCPMGLVKQAIADTPFSVEGFGIPGTPLNAIVAFAKWWDAQTDALAAMDAVWSKPRKKKS